MVDAEKEIAMSRSDSDLPIQCGCAVAIILFNLIAGAISVNYLLLVFLGKTIPSIGAAVIGLFVGEFSVPVAIVVWILKACGVF